MTKFKIGTLLMVLALLTSCAKVKEEETLALTTQENLSAETAAVAGDETFGSYSDKDLTVATEAETTIDLADGATSVTGTGVTVAGDQITITSGGTYLVTGSLTDGQLHVKANKETDDVRLIFQDVTLTNKTGAAFYVESADKVIVTLAAGSQNVFSDEKDYTFASATEDEPNATIFSQDDLTFNGEGELTVTANYQDGIRSKDDLVFVSGTYQVTAVNNGLKGKDSVSILAGTYAITAENDGIQATNSEEEGLGWVAFDGGVVSINAAHDGVQAATAVRVAQGELTIKTGSGANAQGSTSTESYKGIKAQEEIYLQAGTFAFDTADDSLHSNGNVTIEEGTYQIASGDDGVHADDLLTINGGTLDVRQSFEGLEGREIVVNGGDITVVSSDDGVNAAGGSDQTEEEGEGNFGPDSFSQGSGEGTLTINGGTLRVDAEGDGLDSNGDIIMTGGTALVDGPTMGGNSSLDYDGEFVQSGGTLVAVGSQGMAMSPSDSSTQTSLTFYFDQSQQAETLVNLSDASGKNLITYKTQKAWQHLIISTPAIQQNEAYTLSINGSVKTEMSDQIVENSDYTGTDLVTVTPASSVNLYDEGGETVTGKQFGGGGGRPGGMTGEKPPR